MSKTGLFLTSFVAAVPGGLMAYLMVMAFLNHSGGPNMWTKALAGMLLFIGGLLGVLPVGILLFAGPKTEKQPKKAKEKPASKVESGEVEAESGELEAESGELEAELEEADEDGEPAIATTDKNLVVVEEDEFAMTGEMVAVEEEAGGDEFDMGDDFETDAEVVDSDDMLEVEEDEPKKGKKK